MDERIIALYDSFTHGLIDRRRFMERLAGLAGSVGAAAALAPMLANNYAKAAVVAPDDARLQVERGAYKAQDAEMRGYLARLKGGPARRPAVIVIHEARGLNPHIEDVARRMALEGFLAFAVDMLSPAGGTPADEDKAREMMGALDREATIRRLADAVPHLAQRAGSTGAVGAVGFCWGGGMVNELAAAAPGLKAGVAYYGVQVDAAKAAKIRGALLLHYAGIDPRINAGIDAYAMALKGAGVPFEKFLYEGANHAFNNDTGQRYDKAASDLAWSRTVAFLKRHLGEPMPA